ncbi:MULTISPECIES: TIGR04141 family sporadically distributed protein [Frankia]|uniref:TIGR04141 family sporadically distributed protein n=1 Tax=Frankia TaxID=1854 RepID=UPI0012FFBFF9|nr:MULTISPECIES: TIGR04141 family sporadically distributed protein [Frankia]
MAHKPWLRSNIYLLRRESGQSLTDLVELDENPDKRIDRYNLRIDDQPALLVHASVSRSQARWSKSLTALTGAEIATGSSNPSAVLLIDLDGPVFALCYGTTGIHMLSQHAIEQGFGLRIAIRVLEAEKIRQLTRLSLDSRARVDRSSVAGGQEVGGFGVETFAEIVNRIAGRTSSLNISYARERAVSFSLEGADGLRLYLPTDPLALIDDLRGLLDVLRQPPAEGLEFIEKVERLRRKDRRIPGLDRRLAEALDAPGQRAVGLSVPGPYLDEQEEIQSYELKLGRNRRVSEEVELEQILGLVAKINPEGRRAALRRGRIVGCTDRDGMEPCGQPTAAELWVTAELPGETPEDPHRYVFQQGHWYEVHGQEYLDFLRREVENILDARLPWSLPPWPMDRKTGRRIHEGCYNRKVAEADERFVLLDKNLIRSPTHPTGFETCDLLGPDGELIHVKKADSSAPLSHLFSQGLISADTLCIDRVAVDQLKAKISAVSPNHAHLVERPRAVVYAIHLAGGMLTPESLFTFATIALVRAYRHIYSRLGIPTYAIGIPSTP